MNRKAYYFWIMVFLSLLVNYLDFMTTEYCLGPGMPANGPLWEKNAVSSYLFRQGAGRFSIVFIQVYVVSLTLLSLSFHLYVYPLLKPRWRRCGLLRLLRLLRWVSIVYPYSILSAKIFISLSNFLIGYHVRHPFSESVLSVCSAFWYEQVVATGNAVQSRFLMISAVFGAISGFYFCFRQVFCKEED